MNVLIYITPSPPTVTRVEPRGLPLGPLAIGTYAKHAGHNVKIVDGNAYKSLAEVTCDGFAPDVLGVSMLTMYGVLVMDQIRDFISEIRTVADPTVVFGSTGSSVLSEVLLRENVADYVVLGPGENVFLDLLSALEAGSGVSGIPSLAYLDGGSYVETPRAECGGGHGMSLPMDYSLLDVPRYFYYMLDDRKGIDLSASRGCKYRCTFCFNEYFFGCAYQTRPVPVLISEMKFLNETYGITNFTIMDECFGYDKEWLHAFCNAVIAELPPVTWWCQFHGGVNTKEDYELMLRAGGIFLLLGVETGDPGMSRKIRKGVDLPKLQAEIEMLQDMGFWVYTAYVLGFPDETREQLMNTCKFMLGSKSNAFYISKFYLIPHTKLYEELESRGSVTMPKTIEEFQAFLSPKRYRNYANVPEHDLDVILAFFNIAFRLQFLFEKGASRHLKSFFKTRGKGSGGDKRYLIYILAFMLKMMWFFFAYPWVRRRYGLTFRNFKRPEKWPSRYEKE